MRILIFNPFSGIAYYTHTLNFLASKMKSHEHEVSYIGCNGFLNRFCINYSAHGVSDSSSDELKKKTCQDCQAEHKKVKTNFNQAYQIDDYSEKNDIDRTNSLIAQFQGKLIEEIAFEGFDVGKIAAYDFILNHKIVDINQISAELKKVYFDFYLFNACRFILAFRRFLSKHKFDIIVTYNSNYGINYLAWKIANDFTIRHFFVHGGLNLEKIYDSLYFSNHTPAQWRFKIFDYFRDHLTSLKLDYANYHYPLSHVKAIFSASSGHTYSTKRSRKIPEWLQEKIKDYRKVVLVSLSSGDEAYAVDYAIEEGKYAGRAKNIFADRYMWLQALLDYFSKLEDVVVIFRFHPREYPTKLKAVRSTSASRLESFFTEEKKNIVLNLPTDNISIYDLFSIVDLHLCAQTTVGLESSIYGIPTISYVKGIGAYPIESVAIAPDTIENYFSEISMRLIKSYEPNLNAIKHAFEWLLFVHVYTILNFDTKRFWYKKPLLSNILFKVQKVIWGSYNYMSRSTILPRKEEEKFFDFLENNTELLDHYIKQKESINTESNDLHMRYYLIGLLEIWLGLDLEKLKSFSHLSALIKISDAEEASFDGTTLILPRLDKVSQSLSQALLSSNEKAI